MTTSLDRKTIFTAGVILAASGGLRLPLGATPEDMAAAMAVAAELLSDDARFERLQAIIARVRAEATAAKATARIRVDAELEVGWEQHRQRRRAMIAAGLAAADHRRRRPPGRSSEMALGLILDVLEKLSLVMLAVGALNHLFTSPLKLRLPTAELVPELVPQLTPLPSPSRHNTQGIRS